MPKAACSFVNIQFLCFLHISSSILTQVRKPAEAEKFRLEKIAEAERNRVVLEAEAEAEAQTLRGEAEAYAIGAFSQ